MGNNGNQKPSTSIAKIEGKTTPFGFEVKLFDSLSRNSFLSAYHEDKNYVLSVASVWNSDKGSFGQVKVIGPIPLTPFKMDSNILKADEGQIIDALGLNADEEKSISIGKIMHTNIEANINVEKMGRVFITGRSGSGKSYTVGVFIEELVKKSIPLVIIDRHGEYSSLKILEKNNIPADEEFFDKNDATMSYAEHFIEFGDEKINPWVDLDLDFLLASKMKEVVVPGNVSIINLRGLDIPIQENVIEQICSRLYKASTLGDLPPHYIFIDEAHLFAGKKKKPVKETLKLLAQEGRKFGANLVLITQKPQALDTTIRSQAGTWIIHKLTDVNDVRITCNSAEGLGTDMQDEIQNLTPGQSIITGDIAPHCPLMVKVRLRYTVHGGSGFNILDSLKDGTKIPKATLVQTIKNNINNDLREQVNQDILTSEKITNSELHHRLEKFKLENIELNKKISDLKNKLQELEEINSQTTIIKHPSDVDDEFDSVSAKLAGQPTFDDAFIKKLEKEKEDLEVEIQTMELEMSGLKVEVNEIKDKFKNEQKRADDALKVAEKLMQKLKSKKK